MASISRAQHAAGLVQGEAVEGRGVGAEAIDAAAAGEGVGGSDPGGLIERETIEMKDAIRAGAARLIEHRALLAGRGLGEGIGIGGAQGVGIGKGHAG